MQAWLTILLFAIKRRAAACLRRLLLVAALGAPLSALPAWSAENENEPLPELGDSTTRVLSPAQEKRIGQQFLRQLLKNSAYINDPELNAYLNQLATKVAQHASLRGTPITAYLFNDPSLNAFAVPGGHITFHTGLILATQDESELASVMGHEIAHLTQRHMPRMLAKAEASKLPAAAAILASVLIGGQAGLAGISVANAALLSQQLAYTRGFEREADAIGIKLLAQAEFDPSAMGRFFTRLDRHGELNQAPEFLRTHPLSYTRIAEAENRAALYPPANPPAKDSANRAFYLAKAKIRAQYASRAPDTVGYFSAQVDNAIGDQQDVARYGLALAYLTMRQFDRASATLQPLLAAHPNETAFQLARANIDLLAGRPQLAAERYAQLSAAQPQLRYLTYYHANALLANTDPAGAKRVLRHQLRRHKDMYNLYPLLSKCNAKLGLWAESHQATAEFYAALGDYPAAVVSLKLALRENDSEGYLQQSISARLSELEEMLK